MGTVNVEEVGWYPVEDVGTAAIARRAAAGAGRQLGLTETRLGELDIALAEITSNLHRHAHEGTLQVRCLRRDGIGGVEVVALDRGPGMPDPEYSGRDGHSTAGTLGIGLGAIRRLASESDLYSWPGRGTCLVAQFWPRAPGAALAASAAAAPGAGTPSRPELPGGAAAAGGISRPMSGETDCGDRYAVRPTGTGHLLLVCDGLGHGSLAAVAAMAAVDAFLSGPVVPPGAMVARLHARLSHTRGAAVGVAELDGHARTVVYAGLGNVSAHVVGSRQRRCLVSLPGIAGHRSRTVREFSEPLPPGALLVLHSDGVSDRWDLCAYPGLERHEPLTVAATLLRDAGVRRDDASVLVARADGPPDPAVRPG